MRNKSAINPVTLRSAIPGHPAVVLLRAGLGIGSGPVDYTVSVAMVDEAHKQPLAFTMLTQSLFIGALGHLFPAGELKEAHLNPDPIGVEAPACSNPIGAEIAIGPQGACALGLGQLHFAAARTTVRLYPAFFGQPEKNPSWQPTAEQIVKIEATRGTVRNGEIFSCLVNYDAAGRLHIEVEFNSPQAMHLLLPAAQAMLAEICK